MRPPGDCGLSPPVSGYHRSLRYRDDTSSTGMRTVPAGYVDDVGVVLILESVYSILFFNLQINAL